MGFLDKLFGKKEKEKEPVKEMSFDDAIAFIKKSEQTTIKEVYEGLEDASNQLRSFYAPLYKKLEVKRELPKQIPAQIRQKVDATRMQARKKLNVLNSNLNLPTTSDSDKLFDFHKKLTKNLFEMVQFATIYTQVINNALPNEKIPEELGEIKAISNSLTDFLEPKLLKLNQYREFNRSFEKYKSLLADRAQSELLNATSRKTDVKQQGEKKALESELKELMESETYKKALQIKADIDTTEKKIKNHINVVKTSISSIDRALRKWATANSTTHSIIDNYINDTFDAIIDDKNQTNLMEIMNSLYDQVLSDEIELKSNIKMRTMETIDSFRGGTLKQSIISIINLSKKLETLHARYNLAIFRKVQSLKTSLATLVDKKSNSHKFEANLSAIETKLNEQKQSLIDRLEAQFNIRAS